MLNGWHHSFLCGQWYVSTFCEGLDVHGNWEIPWATAHDLNYHVCPILRKKPKHIIVQIGTNNASRSTSREILEKLLKLKTLVKETLPETEVTFSTLTITSDNGKAALTVRNLCEHILGSNMDMLDNRNITSKHLGRKGLYLNKAGSTHLEKNIIHKLRKFWWSSEHFESLATVSSNIYRPPLRLFEFKLHSVF